MSMQLLNLIIFLFLALPCFGGYSIQDMTLEEKVGQLLMVHFHGEAANEDARTLIQDTKVGSIIYYEWSNGLKSPGEVRMLSSSLQKLAKENRLPIPLIIAVDQEGGIVTRLKGGFTEFPGNKALAMTGNPKLAEKAAYIMGREMKAVGITLNLAPVVDINSNPRNPIIGIRSYGEDHQTVISFAKMTLKGFKKAGLPTTLKHFPGHGDVEVDSHDDLPIVQKPLDELKKSELLVFEKLASFADALMVGHLLVPALDEKNCSTVSEKTLSYVRNELGFHGIVITDSLVMQSVLKKCQTVSEAAILALNAGCDILLLGGKQLINKETKKELSPNDIKCIHAALIDAVHSGRISESRIDEAVCKILKMKKGYKESLSDLAKIVGTKENHIFAESIASLAIKAVKEDHALLTSLHQKKMTVFAPQFLDEALNQSSLSSFANLYYFQSTHPSQEDREMAMQHAQEADVLCFFSYNAWKNPSQAALICSLLDLHKPFVLITLRDSLDALLFPQADVILNTFSPSGCSIRAVSKRLMKK